MWSIYVFAILAGASAYGGILLAQSRWLSNPGRVWLAAVALGIIIFVIYDVLSDAQVLIAGDAPRGGYSAVGWLGVLLSGMGGGLGVLVGIERAGTRPDPAIGTERGLLEISPRPLGRKWGPGSLPLPVVVAAGIGVHGLFEGFAVGTAFATGILSVALVLAIGMCLHKMGEGVCICGCSVAASNRYSSAQLGGLGLLAGGPIFLGILTGNFVAAIPLISIFSYGAAVGVMGYVSFHLGRAVWSERTRLSIALAGGTIGFAAGALTSLLVALGSG